MEHNKLLGEQAYQNGKTVYDNPYEIATEEFEEWLRGFYDSKLNQNRAETLTDEGEIK